MHGKKKKTSLRLPKEMHASSVKKRLRKNKKLKNQKRRNQSTTHNIFQCCGIKYPHQLTKMKQTLYTVNFKSDSLKAYHK